jgi:acetyl-CoA C-acetyltransferase
MTGIGRLKSDYFTLLENAAREILNKTDPGRIGSVFYASFAPAELCGIEDPAATVTQVLSGISPELDAPVHGPYKTGGEALFSALEMMTGGGAGAGAYPGGDRGDVLLIACEKMTHLKAGTAAGLLAPRVNPVEKLYGATLPALGALVTREYIRTRKVPFRAIHTVSVKNHRNASRNPLAHFRKEIDINDVAASPLVADPLRRHHCAPMSDGAAACLLTTTGEGISIRGWGIGEDAPLFHERRNLGRLEATARAAKAAFEHAGVRRDEIDVVEIHDAFSPFELINLEELGFFPPGRAWHALVEGQLDPGGSLAVNTSGGMKARGHPIGVCGLSSLAELYLQLTGTAGRRQHSGARLGVIQSAGGVSRHCYVFVMGD